jgi:hypothetical protein
MAIHRSGALQPVAGDLQTTHAGVAIAIKMIDWGSGLPVLGLIEKKGSIWEVIKILYEFDDPTQAMLVEKSKVINGLVDWIRTEIVPLVNAALLARFPATGTGGGGTPPPTPTGDILTLVDNMLIGKLKFAPQANGTIRVESL